MAQGISIKLPLQVDDIDGPFSLHKTDMSAIHQNLKVLLLTNPGERIMKPDFGVGVRGFLFEQNSEGLKERIHNRIIEQIGTYMPYVKITDLTVDSPPIMDGSPLDDTTIIEISVSYFVPNLRRGNTLRIPLVS